MFAEAHTQGLAKPCGQSLGEFPPDDASKATHCMPLGVQISTNGSLATTGTTHAPSTPCNAENTVHSNTQRSHSAWRCADRRVKATVKFFTTI